MCYTYFAMLISFKKIKVLESVFSFILLAVIFLAPLIISRSFIFPFNTAKLLIVYLGAALALPPMVMLMLVDSRYKFKRNDLKLFFPLNLFLLALIISGLAGVSFSHSFWSSFERGTGIFFMLAILIVACGFYSLIKVQGKSFLIKSLMVMTASGLLIAISTYPFVTNMFGTKDIMSFSMSGGGGLFGNSSVTGTFLLFTIISALVLFFISQVRWQKIFSACALLLIITSPNFFIPNFSSLISMIGQARGVVLGLIFGVFVGLCTYLVWNSKLFFRVLGWCGILLSTLTIIIGGYLLVRPESQAHKFFVKEAGQMRFIYWSIAGQGLAEHPLLGSGPENFEYVFQKHFDPALWSAENSVETFTDRPHNIFVEQASNGGVLGLLCFLFFLASFYLYAVILVRRGVLSKMIGAVIIGGLSAYILQGQFVFDSILSYLYLLVLFGFLAGLIPDNKTNTSEDIKNKKVTEGYELNGQQISFIFGSICISIFILITGVFLPARQATAMVSMLNLNISDGIGSYSNWPPIGNTDDINLVVKEVVNQYALGRAQILADVVNREKIIGSLKDFRNFISKLSDQNSIDYRLAYNTANLTSLIKTFDSSYSNDKLKEGLAYAKRAENLSPSNPQAYWTIASLDFYLGDISDAKEAAKRSVELNKTVSDSYLLLLNIANASGDQKLFQDTALQAISNIPGFEQKYLKRNTSITK